MSRSHGMFQTTGGVMPYRSTFDLSYSKKFDATFGLVYPVCCDEVVPGDTWHGGNQIVCRAVVPLKAPVMQNWRIYTHYFFVPYRILDEKWEEFITGGVNGDSDVSLPLSYVFARRNSATAGSYKDAGGTYNTVGAMAEARTGIGSLADFLYGVVNVDIPNEDLPMAYPEMAYYSIFNDYYRDENLMHPIMCRTVDASGTELVNRHPVWKLNERAKGNLETFSSNSRTQDFTNGCPYLNKGLFYRSWKKDYFTASLPWQQRGSSPTLPIHLISSTTLNPGTVNQSWMSTFVAGSNFEPLAGTATNGSPFMGASGLSSSNLSKFNSNMNAKVQAVVNQMTATTTTTQDPAEPLIDVNDLRWMFQMQKWLERNARGGFRYTEFLKEHYHISPRDERLQRPEYLGGSAQSIVVSEVLQTSATESGTTAQGNMAGHGLSVNAGHCFDYTAAEHGLIMGLMSIMPAAEYQQGLNRQWSRRVREEFFFPEFQHLSEQAILGKEIYMSNDTNKNNQPFGYIGVFDELRTKHNLTCGRLRNGESFDYWTMSRFFSDLPQLNSSFIVCKPQTVGIFASDENPFIVNFGNIFKVTRPIAREATPGLVDHF